jgi:hypothetical protein
MDRHVALYRRQMQAQILASFILAKRPEEIGDYLPVVPKGADQEWTTRLCRAEVDMERIIHEARQENLAVAHLSDDSLPTAYPTVHFGESVFSAMLGGQVQFVGTGAHTCSGAEPLLNDWSDLPGLRYGRDMPWTQRYLKSLRAAADLDASGMFFWHFVTIDTLNLAVELRGSTKAYLDVVDSPAELAELMRFGVDYALWFHQLEQEIIGPHNLAVAQGHCYASEAPYIGRPWSSVDAYLLCDSRAYRDMGLSYHVRFFESCGGGAMHTHGARLLELLPMIVQIPALTAIQVGRDLPDGRELPLPDILPEIRRIAGDIPLIRCLLWQDEFERGLREHRLVGGTHYIVRCPVLDADQVSRWMEQVYRYRWHG